MDCWRLFARDVVPFIAMVSVECSNVGVNTLFKAASLKGMSYYVFIVYSYAISTLVFIPVSIFFFFIFRSSSSSPVLPSLKLSLLYRIFLLALIGFLAQMAGYKGIEYSSPTLSSAMSNLTPAFTFALAVLFRMEKLVMRSKRTQAKVVGTTASIAGALVVVLYKGPTILGAAASPKPTKTMSLHWLLGSATSDWLIGGLLLSTQYLLFSIWYILQAEIMKICPIELLVTFVYTLCVTIISAPVCFIAEKNSDAWRLRPAIALTAILFSGIFGPCYSTAVHSWGIRLKGPVYVAIFKPLSIAIAAISGVIFLGDALHLGIIAGAVVIAMGFYAVMWGKASEERSCDDHCKLLGSSETAPFLQTAFNER